MFALLRKFSWVGGLIALARGPMGQRVVAEVKQRSARRNSGPQGPGIPTSAAPTHRR